MNPDARIIRRLEELIAVGDRVLATKRDPGLNVIADDLVDSAIAAQWATSTQSLLSRVFGRDSDHYANFAAQVNKFITFSPALRAQGVLRAALDDIQAGALFEVRTLIRAEMFADFLEQAQTLFDAGYYQPAAVIAGAVLEDGLRKLCGAHGIPLPERPKLDWMNSELAKRGAYNKLVQKRVTALADLRHKAAHGQWEEFGAKDVEEMLLGVSHFMEERVA